MRYAAAMIAIVIAAAVIVHFLPSHGPLLLDEANLLNGDERAFVARHHGYLVDDYDIDYRVITSTADTAMLEHAVGLYEKLGVGSRSDWGRGLLLVINPATNRVRLEVGYALEGTFPDAFIAYVEKRQMVPFFADGRVADGILATTELIVDRAQRAADRNGPGADEVWMMGSGGAGAQTEARIGEKDSSLVSGERSNVDPATSPSEALSAYLAAMDARNFDPHLAVYSPESQAMMEKRTFTPAQADMVIAAYRDCAPQPVRYSQDGALAVIRYPPEKRGCSPWFFVKTDGNWTLDLAALNRSIRFGRTNAWHRSEDGFGAYAFGFDDWSFDRHGFPE